MLFTNHFYRSIESFIKRFLCAILIFFCNLILWVTNLKFFLVFNHFVKNFIIRQVFKSYIIITLFLVLNFFFLWIYWFLRQNNAREILGRLVFFLLLTLLIFGIRLNLILKCLFIWSVLMAFRQSLFSYFLHFFGIFILMEKISLPWKFNDRFSILTVIFIKLRKKIKVLIFSGIQ